MPEIVHAPCYRPGLARRMTNVWIPKQSLIVLDRSKCFEWKSDVAGKGLEDSGGVETRVMATLLELPGESDKGQHVAVRANGIDEDPHTPFPG